MLTPAMQGVIFAIAKARQVFDTDGPEAGLIKVYIQIIILINLDIKLVYLVLYLASSPCLFLWKSFGSLHQAFHEEYCRLYELSQEETTPQQDPRLQHVLVYFFQNQAPNRVIERTLLEQFADRNLSFDDRYPFLLNQLLNAVFWGE